MMHGHTQIKLDFSARQICLMCCRIFTANNNSKRAPSACFQVIFTFVVVCDYASVEFWPLMDPLSVRRGGLVEARMKVGDRITRGWMCTSAILYVQSLHRLACDSTRGCVKSLMMRWRGDGVGCNAIPLEKLYVLLGTSLAQSRTCVATECMTGISFTATQIYWRNTPLWPGMCLVTTTLTALSPRVESAAAWGWLYSRLFRGLWVKEVRVLLLRTLWGFKVRSSGTRAKLPKRICIILFMPTARFNIRAAQINRSIKPKLYQPSSV
jgi:hypothetical protein